MTTPAPPPTADPRTIAARHAEVPAAPAAPRRAWPYWFAMITLIAGVLLTGIATHQVRKSEEAVAAEIGHTHLKSLADQLVYRHEGEQLIMDTAALLTGMMGKPTDAQWAGMMAAMRLTDFPGIVAIGYARLRSTDGAYHGVTIERLFAPGGSARASLGADLMADPVLANAIGRAIDSGETQWSTLVGQSAGEKTITMISPVYVGGLRPPPPVRRELALGVVFAENRVSEPGRVLGQMLADGDYLALYDAPEPGADQRLALKIGDGGDLLFSINQQYQWGGRPWSLVTGRSRASLVTLERSRSLLTMTAGAALTLVFVLMLVHQGRLRRRVEREIAAATDALQYSELRHRQLAGMSSDWFWEQDAHYRFTYMSDGITAFGTNPEAYLGRTRWEMSDLWTAEQIAEHVRVLDAHQPFRRFEYVTTGADGGLRRYMISADPLFDGEGNFAGYRGVGRDVTESRRLAQALRDQHDRLESEVALRTADLRMAKEVAEAAGHAKSEFIANMSHELRTPLHAIMSFAKLGESKTDTTSADKLKGYFEKIHSAGGRLLKLVNDLLDLSKMEAGKMLVFAKQEDLAALVGEVADELQPLLDKSKIRLMLPASKRAHLVELDAARMAQVLRNLLSNAIKFSPAHSTVTVEIDDTVLTTGAGQTLPGIMLTVMDEGVGIPENELDAVFDKFVQSSKTKTGAGGTGLGLSISREIVEAHGGKIRAYNRTGGGAAFELTLPLTHHIERLA